MQIEGLIFTNSNLDQAQLKAQEEERQKREAEEKKRDVNRPGKSYMMATQSRKKMIKYHHPF